MDKHQEAIAFSSRVDHWETPPELFAALHQEFAFTGDIGAHQSNTLLPRWVGPRLDALDIETEWGNPGEAVYCNPPYGRGVAEWITRALWEQSRGVTVVMLLPARTDTRWFHDLVQPHAEVRFLRGRVRFRLLGEPIGPAPFPSMICVFRGNADAAEDFRLRRQDAGSAAAELPELREAASAR